MHFSCYSNRVMYSIELINYNEITTVNSRGNNGECIFYCCGLGCQSEIKFNSAKKPSKRPAAAADGSIVLFCAASYGGRFQTRDH